MATITHPTGNGYCRDRILRDSPTNIAKEFPSTIILWLRERTVIALSRPRHPLHQIDRVNQNFCLTKGTTKTKSIV